MVVVFFVCLCVVCVCVLCLMSLHAVCGLSCDDAWCSRRFGFVCLVMFLFSVCAVCLCVW